MTRAAGLTRRLLRLVAIAALVLGAIALRVTLSARQELHLGHGQLSAGDIDAALLHYRRAARFYVPGGRYHVQALDRLGVLADQAERRGDIDRALAAQRAIRGAILAARSVYIPERERLRSANARIASLMAGLPPPGVDAGKTEAQIRAEHLALLEADPDPNLFWTLVLLAGFAGWVGSAFVFSQRAIDENDRFVQPAARTWGALIALGFGLFALGLALA